MPALRTVTVALTRHPDTPSSAIRSIEARVSTAAGGVLGITYVLRGAIDRVRVPPPAPPRMAEALWQHTCCELFVRRPRDAAYHELNFSPSGEWAAYGFEAYRERPSACEHVKPTLGIRRAEQKLELETAIRLERLSPVLAESDLCLAVAAVIEDSEGALSYWALAHPDGKPDFHSAEAFALELT